MNLPDNLPERLITLADSLDGCEWNHPITAADDCRKAAEVIERLRKPDFYWVDRNLERSYESIDDAIDCDEVGVVIELRPIHELPSIRVRVTDEGYEEITRAAAEQAAKGGGK